MLLIFPQLERVEIFDSMGAGRHDAARYALTFLERVHNYHLKVTQLLNRTTLPAPPTPRRIAMRFTTLRLTVLYALRSAIPGPPVN